MKIILFLPVIFCSVLILTACSPAGQELPPTEEQTAAETVDQVPETADLQKANTPIAAPTKTDQHQATISAAESPAPPEAEDDLELNLPAAGSEPLRQTIRMNGAENLGLGATFTVPGEPGPHPGVLLLHMLGSDRQVWEDNGLTRTLADNGFAVLAVDLRGHGETGGEPDWILAEEDLRLVWDQFSSMEGVDPQRTAVVGASIGANLALVTAAHEPGIKTVVLLSPGLDYRGVTTEDQIALYDNRPILIIASEEDGYAAESSRALAETAVGEAVLEIYQNAGHGTRMFSAQPALSDLIVQWLLQNVNS